MEIFVTVITRTGSAHVFAYEEVGVDRFPLTTPTPIFKAHFTMHHPGAFQARSSTFPGAESISVLPLQAKQLVNNSAGFETWQAFQRTLCI